MQKGNDNTERSGLSEVLKLSTPASLSMLNRTLTQFVDGVMVAKLGPATISAQAIGGLIAFVPESFSIGMLGVVNTYVSQNLGAGRPRRCGQYAWAGLTIVMVLSVFLCPLATLARPLFALIGHAPDVQPLEVLYFRYMILAVPVTMSIRVLEAFFYGVHRPGVVYTISLVANAFNIAANYVLIFGHLGFPAMGLEGAAIGTVASWFLQLAVLLAAFLRPKIHQQFRTRWAWALRWKQCRDVFHTGWPAGVTFLIDMLTWSIFTAKLIGHFGTAHLTAATAAVRYMTLSFMPTVGISIATTALVGRYIGQGRHDLARQRAYTGLKIAMVYMGGCALAFLLLREPMVRLFVNVTPQDVTNGITAESIVAIGGRIMICAAVFQIFDAMAIVFNGALRGAGDTRWPMIVGASLCVVILVGGGSAMVYLLPQLESLGPYIAATVYVILLGLVMARRFESGAWRKIDLLGKGPSPRSG